MSRSRKTATQGFEDRTHQKDAGRFTVGVVGLGLMGTSIATCLLAAGHPVVGVERDPSKRSRALRRVLGFLREMKAEKVLRADPSHVAARFSTSEDFTALAGCEVVIESIFENVEDKREVLKNIEAVVSGGTIIGINTSAIPITILQQGIVHPERVLGIHWGEPAQTLRFMEIICGDQTDEKFAERARKLAQGWDKEPSP